MPRTGQGTVPAEDTTYTAQYKADLNNDGTPDDEQYVDVTFTIAEEDAAKGTLEGETSYTDLVPGLELTVPEVADKEGDDWAFDGWTPALTEGEDGNVLVPSETTNYVATWKEDKNHDNTPDEDQYVTLTFESAYGFEDDVESPYEMEKQVPGLTFQAPTPVDTDTDNVVFVGWDNGLAENGTGTVPAEDTTYTAQYKADLNNDGTPDDEQYVDVTFAIAEVDGSKGTLEGETSYTDLVPGLELTVPTVADTEGDDWAFDGWTPALTEGEDGNVLVPSETTNYVATWKEDKNHDNTPDEDQYVTLTFESAYGFEDDVESPYEMEKQVPGLTFQAPTPVDTDTDNVVFVGWDNGLAENGTGTVPAEDTTYTAQYKEDLNNDGTPDDEQYVDVTFAIAEVDGSKGTLEGETSYTDLVPGLELTVPTVADTEGDDWAFDGWTPALTEGEDGNVLVPSETTNYVATWKEDKNHDNTPDEDQYVTLTFESAYGFEDDVESPYEMEKQVPGLTFQAPTPVDTDTDNVVFVGWDNGLAENGTGTVPAEDTTYTAQYKADLNNDGTPDDEQYVDVTFAIAEVDGSKGTLEGETSYTDLVPGLELTVPTVADTEGDDWAFDGWTPALTEGEDGNVLVPSETTNYVATWKEDKNHDNTPDEDQYVTLTFESAYGFEDDVESPYEMEKQVPGLTFQAPTPVDTDTDNVVFVGWDNGLAENGTGTVPAEDTTYTAQYKEDLNNDGTPDDEQYVDVTFAIAEVDGSKGTLEGETSYTDLVPGLELTVPTVADTEGDDWAFDGWTPALTEGEDGNVLVPSETTNYVATWKEDKNHDNIPDEDQYVTLTFESAYGFEDDVESPYEMEKQVPGLTFQAPTPVDTDTDNVVFVGWDNGLAENGTGTVPAEDTTYTAQYKEDLNNDGTPDDEQYVDVTFAIAEVDGSKGTLEGETSYTDLVPGLELTVPTVADTEGDDWAFDGWTPALTEGEDGNVLVPSADTNYVATWKEDKNHDNIPDEDQYVTLTFESAYGFEDDVESPYEMEKQVPGLTFQAPTPVDTDTDNVVFVGWDNGLAENGAGTVPAEDTTYTAQYKADLNNDGTPDDEQYVDVTFTIAEEDAAKGTLEGETSYTDLVPGLELTVPEVADKEGDDWAFDGWTPALTEGEDGNVLVPSETTNYVATWKEDKNHDNTPDEDQYVTLTFESAYGFERRCGVAI